MRQNPSAGVAKVTHQIKAPDGNTYAIEGPKNATQKEVAAAVIRQKPTAGKPPAPVKPTPKAAVEIGKRTKELDESAASLNRMIAETQRLSKLPGATASMREKANVAIEEYRKTLANIANEKGYMQRTGTLVPERSFGEIATDTLKGLGAGALRTVAGIPSLLGAVGIESPGKASEQAAERFIQRNLAPDESDAAQFGTFAQQGRRLSEVAGSVLPAFATRGASRAGMAVAGPRAVPILTRTEQAAQLALGAGPGAQQQRQAIEQYEAETGKVVNPLVRALAQAGGAAIGATEVLTLDAMMARVPSKLRGSMTSKLAGLVERIEAGGISPKAAAAEVRTLMADIQKTGRGRVGVAMLEEGTQEGTAQFAQNVLEKTAYNSEKDVTEGVAENFIYGAVVGGGVRGLTELVTKVTGGVETANKIKSDAKLIAATMRLQENPNDDAAFDTIVERMVESYGITPEKAALYAQQQLGRAREEGDTDVPDADTGVDDFGGTDAGTASDIGTTPSISGATDVGETVGGGLERAVSGVSTTDVGEGAGVSSLDETKQILADKKVKLTERVNVARQLLNDTILNNPLVSVNDVDQKQFDAAKKQLANGKYNGDPVAALEAVTGKKFAAPLDVNTTVEDVNTQEIQGGLDAVTQGIAENQAQIKSFIQGIEENQAKLAAAPEVTTPPLDVQATAPVKTAIESVTTPAPDASPIPSLAQASAQQLGITPTAAPEAAPEMAAPEVAPLSREEKPVYDPADYTPQEIYDNLTRFGYKEAERRGYVFNTAENGMFGEGVREAKNPDIQPLTDEQVLSLERGSPEVLAAYKEGQQWGKEQVAAVQAAPVAEEAALEAAPVQEPVQGYVDTRKQELAAQEAADVEAEANLRQEIEARKQQEEAAPVAEAAALEAAPVAEEVAPEVVTAPIEEAAPEVDPYAGVLADIEAALADEAIDARTHKLLTSAVERRLPLEKIEAQLDVARTRSAERAMGASNSERATPSERLQGLIYRMQDAWKVLTGKPILANARLADLLRDPDILSKMNPAQRGLAAALADVIDDDVDVYIGNLNFSPQEAFTLGTATVYDGAAPDVRLRGVSTAANIVTLLHEAVHIALIAKFGSDFKRLTDLGPDADPEMLALRDEVYNLIDAYNTMFEVESSADLLLKASPYGMKNLDEFIAEGLTQPSFQKFLEKGNLWTRFVALVRKLLKLQPKFQPQLDNVLKAGAKLIAASKNIDRMEYVSGTFEQRKKAAPKGKGSAQERVATGEAEINRGVAQAQMAADMLEFTDGLSAAIDGRDGSFFLPSIKEGWASFNDATREYILPALTSSFIINDIDKGRLPPLRRMETIEANIRGAQNRMRAQFGKLDRRFTKFVNRTGQRVLATTMHAARINEFSPSDFSSLDNALQNDPIMVWYNDAIKDPTVSKGQVAAFKGKKTIREKQIKAVWKLWEELGKQKNGHDIYVRVRDFYADMYTIMRTEQNSFIKKLPIDDAAKEELLVAVDPDTFAEGEADPNDPHAGIPDSVRPKEYFPFRRYGKYWLTVKGDGIKTGRERHHFETAFGRNAFLRKRAKELGVDPQNENVFEKGNTLEDFQNNLVESSLMLSNIFSVIDKAVISGNYDTTKYATPAEALEAMKKELRDKLYQTYLMTLPERSLRRQFIHAERVTGFSSDVLRNFRSSSAQYAVQIPKLQYGSDVNSVISEGYDALEGMPVDEKAAARTYVDEMVQRLRGAINPEAPNAFVAGVSRFAFYEVMSSIASAASQMLSVPISVMPKLNADYGYTAAAAAFMRYSFIPYSFGLPERDADGMFSQVMPSIGTSVAVKSNPIRARAFKEFTDRDLFDSSAASSLFLNNEMAHTYSSYNIPAEVLGLAFKAMRLPFTMFDVASREMSAMMFFDLDYGKNRKDGMEPEEAYNAAIQNTVNGLNETIGSHNLFERPRYMVGQIRQLLFLFRMYAVNRTMFGLRMGIQVMRGENATGRTRAAAIHELGGNLAMVAVLGGIAGAPLLDVVCGAIDMILPSLMDDEEEEEFRRQHPYSYNNSKHRFLYEWLPENFGNPTLPGLDGKQHALADVLRNGIPSELIGVNFASRVSWNGMWIRDSIPGENWSESIVNWLETNLSPGAAISIEFIKALEDVYKGDVMRGLEKIVPGTFRGSITAERLSTQGAETRKGGKMFAKDEITALQLNFQRMGWAPNEVSDWQRERMGALSMINAVTGERTDLMAKLNKAKSDPEGSSETVAEVEADIREFNRLHPIPELQIEEEDIAKSRSRYLQSELDSYRGMQLTAEQKALMLKYK
jgi:hypothetical protein